MTKKTKFIFINHIHGKYGLLSEIEKVIKNKAFIILDISQSIGKIPINLKKLNIDASFFSTNKIFGLNGSGILFISKNLQKYLEISEEEIIALERNVSLLSLISLKKGLEFIDEIGIKNINSYLTNLTQYLLFNLRKFNFIDFLPGVAFTKCATGYGILSFTLKKYKPIDILPLLESQKIIVRIDNHCYQEKNKYIRISLHINNDKAEINKLFNTLRNLL